MDNSIAVLKDIGEHEPPNSPPTRPLKRVKLTPIEFTCSICCDTPDPDQVFKLRCDHSFCTPCWEMYITSKIKDEGQYFFQCMQDGCPTAVDEPSIAKLADEPTYERFVDYLLT